VALDYFPDAPKAKVDWSLEVPVLPVVASTLPDLEAKLSSIVAKLEKLPLEEIGADVTKVLVTLNATLQDASTALKHFDTDLTPALKTAIADLTPALKTAIEELRQAVATANLLLKNTDATLLGKDAPAQQELRDALQEVAAAARSVRVLADYLDRHPESLIRGKSEDKP
jgi:paraquat-inducible protein B